MMAQTPVAIVTGAGSGIGRAVCGLLANAGYRLSLIGRRETKLQETMEGIAQRSAAAPEMLILAADLASAQQAMSVVDMTMEQWGRVDALVHSAGNASVVPIDRTDEDLVYRTFSVNTFAAAYLAARLWPVFRKQRGGRIVNVSTMGTADPFPGFFVYAAAKSALESLARSEAKEGAGFGVRAFAIAPGAVETDILRTNFTERQIPRNRTLDPLDVAHVICDCVLGRRDGETGKTIYLPSP
jgi:NAD(P)-dependent dehydrogenase (short-subunit alcohol dehydrogenase family)